MPSPPATAATPVPYSFSPLTPPPVNQLPQPDGYGVYVFNQAAQQYVRLPLPDRSGSYFLPALPLPRPDRSGFIFVPRPPPPVSLPSPPSPPSPPLQPLFSNTSNFLFCQPYAPPPGFAPRCLFFFRF